MDECSMWLTFALIGVCYCQCAYSKKKGECYLQSTFKQTSKPAAFIDDSDSKESGQFDYEVRPRTHPDLTAGVDLVWRPPNTELEVDLIMQASYQCVNSAFLLPKKTQFAITSSDHLEEYAVKFVALADRIYVLCMDCAAVTIPRSWMDKVSLVDGRQVDACLAQVFPVDYAPGGQLDANRQVQAHSWGTPLWLVHGIRVTRAHKFIAANALMNKYPHIAVLESDFKLTKSLRGWSEEDFATLSKFYLTSPWEMLRIGFYALDVANKAGQCYCKCILEPGHHRLCKLRRGCQHIHSSAGYFLPLSAYSKLLGAEGLIDVEVMASFESTLVIPSMLHQNSGGYLELETKAEEQYLKHCVVNSTA